MISPDERLGVTVAPQDVRLQPSTDSDYAWSVMPGKEYLLDTNLGNGSVGLYQEIQQHLGSMIEAVAPRQRDTRHADTTSSVEVSSLIRTAGRLRTTRILTRTCSPAPRSQLRHPSRTRSNSSRMKILALPLSLKVLGPNWRSWKAKIDSGKHRCGISRRNLRSAGRQPMNYRASWSGPGMG